ncbi:MAG TPA: TIGR03084 family metal-binding protein [Noviherbaspirillum sp.]|uniref:TIGR03084 family metal-binding protein n=1 Tax=Noviherbaspirillum sp. TaxID=1926288 RepID=UPI002B496EEB|nr:TIGR03084 family metal-binding protein [Noviherbaspirillum sp.]HJV87742.1 TIGR03084 family metal-binding protein [Noviherbaspirillum sp.]
MKELCADLLAEYQALAELAATMSPAQWDKKTQFYGWTPWDEIAHLCFFDETGLLAATDAAAFADNTRELQQELDKGTEISAITRKRFGHLDGAQLLALWQERFNALVTALATMDPKARLPWYGPMMSARSFATARMMETWAHGQDVYDCLGVRRPATDRLKHIAHIGATTFGWTFVNRKLPVPEVKPYIALRAPGGDTWTWNEASDRDYVRGSAEDFCLVVTQRRNVRDTQLEYAGDVASAWLPIAQCFAGPPAHGPAPGVRAIHY